MGLLLTDIGINYKSINWSVNAKETPRRKNKKEKEETLITYTKFIYRLINGS